MSDYDEDRAPTRHLDAEECWQRLREAPYGRIAAGAAGQIDIFPVNHAVDEEAIIFRTAPGTKLLELTIRQNVAFEVDGYTDDEAFSVVVKGSAVELERAGEIERAERLGIVPWAPEVKDRWVKIMPSDVHGRAFERARPIPPR